MFIELNHPCTPTGVQKCLVYWPDNTDLEEKKKSNMNGPE